MPQALPNADAARAICAQHGNAASELLEILHDVQDSLGHVAPDCLPVIADSLNISKAEVHGVVSFYHDFKTEPDGRVVVKICQAEACRSMGAVALTEQILSRHGVSLSEKTAAGVVFEPVYCLGNCALAPTAMVGGALLGRVRGADVDDALEEAAR